MSWLQQRDTSQGRSVLACAAVFAACFGAFILAGNRSSETSFYSAPAVGSVSLSTPQALAASRYMGSSTMMTRQNSLVPAVQDGAEDFIVVPGVVSSSMRTMGLTAFGMSLMLATAGLALRMITHLQAKQIVAPLSPVELVTVEDVCAMAAATGKKSKVKKSPKGKNAKKGKKEEKPERAPIVLTPRQVFYRMQKGVLRRAKKPTKTTGRVCHILGKVDNRKARSISFSHRRTKRVQKVNLHWRRLYWEEGKCFVLLRLSTKGIKTVTKYGLHQAAIKFGLDLTKHINGTSERKYIKYLPEKEKKLALIRGAQLRYKSAVRWAKLNDLEVPAPPLPRKAAAAAAAAVKEEEPATIAMAISHGDKVARLGRPADQRKALLRSLTTELIRHGRIKTTMVRAKAVRKHVDHMITLAKTGTLHTRRQALAYVYDKNLVKTLFEQVPERYGERPGGYTRIIRTMPRKGDAAKMCYIELV